MDNLFMILFFISFFSLCFSGFSAVSSIFKKNKKKRNNKRLALSSLLALVIAFIGIGITAPATTVDTDLESSRVSIESIDNEEELAKVEEQKKKEQAEKDKKAAEEKEKQEKEQQEKLEQEQITQDLKTLRKSLPDLKFDKEQTVEVNDNIPLFTRSDLSDEDGSWEKYGDLDKLNRATSAEAMLNQDLMPTEKRGDISNVKPTGWANKKLDKGYLYNRSHLIGFALSGENDNWKNLITGTAQLNNPEMLRHELDIKYYLEQDDKNYVRYSVTPIFKDDELLARGVHMMAQSINDDKISFNVFIFNIQDGVNLNYADGSSETEKEIAEAKQAEQDRIKKEAAEKKQAEEELAKKAEEKRIAEEKAKQAEQKRIEEEKAKQAEQDRIEAEKATAEYNPYVDSNGNGLIKGSRSKIYHVPGSTYYDRTTNPEAWFSSIEEAVNAGYRAPER